jgi:hypothetical protein
MLLLLLLGENDDDTMITLNAHTTPATSLIGR